MPHLKSTLKNQCSHFWNDAGSEPIAQPVGGDKLEQHDSCRLLQQGHEGGPDSPNDYKENKVKFENHCAGVSEENCRDIAKAHFFSKFWEKCSGAEENAERRTAWTQQFLRQRGVSEVTIKKTVNQTGWTDQNLE
jgi:hypothetical protein